MLDLTIRFVVLLRISGPSRVKSMVMLAINRECRAIQVYSILFLLYRVMYSVIMLIDELAQI
jgi:hypothetical protein